MKNRMIPATEFKAKCLALLDEVQQEGGSITVTKRGRPVATVTAAKKPHWKSSAGILAGKSKNDDSIDIVNFSTEHLWDALKPGKDILEP